jgi:hypothetical protein
VANNYTQFSIEIAATEAEKDWIKAVWKALNSEDEVAIEGWGWEPSDDYPPCTVEFEADSMVFYSEESGNTDFLCEILQRMLARFDCDKAIAFECAFTCSSPRPGEFGGAAAWITKDGVEWCSTGNWLAEKMKEANDTSV